MNRRDFLKGLASTSVVVAGSSSVLAPLSALAKGMDDGDAWLTTGSHFGAFRIKRRNGVIAEVKPLEYDKYPTDMIRGIRGLVYNPSRIRYPMVRLDFLLKGHKSNTHERGDFRFVRVTWDKALTLFKESLDIIQTQYGPSACTPDKPVGVPPDSCTQAPAICSAPSPCTATSSRKWATTPPAPGKQLCLMCWALPKCTLRAPPGR